MLWQKNSFLWLKCYMNGAGSAKCGSVERLSRSEVGMGTQTQEQMISIETFEGYFTNTSKSMNIQMDIMK